MEERGVLHISHVMAQRSGTIIEFYIESKDLYDPDIKKKIMDFLGLLPHGRVIRTDDIIFLRAHDCDQYLFRLKL